MPQRKSTRKPKPRTLSFAVGKHDLIEYRTGKAWSPAWVRALFPRHLLIEDALTHERRRVPKLDRRLRSPSGKEAQRLVEMIHQAEKRRAQLPPLSGPVVVRAGQSRPVEKPRKRYRAGGYLDFIRRFPCLSAALPPPSEAHHEGARGVSQKADDYDTVPLSQAAHLHITATGCLPGLDPVQTEIVILRAQVMLLKQYIAEHEQADARFDATDRRALDPLLMEVPHAA
jgi:hypothetical protein